MQIGAADSAGENTKYHKPGFACGRGALTRLRNGSPLLLSDWNSAAFISCGFVRSHGRESPLSGSRPLSRSRRRPGAQLCPGCRTSATCDVRNRCYPGFLSLVRKRFARVPRSQKLHSCETIPLLHHHGQKSTKRKPGTGNSGLISSAATGQVFESKRNVVHSGLTGGTYAAANAYQAHGCSVSNSSECENGTCSS